MIVKSHSIVEIKPYKGYTEAIVGVFIIKDNAEWTINLFGYEYGCEIQ